jgi:hypothetical protein
MPLKRCPLSRPGWACKYWLIVFFCGVRQRVGSNKFSERCLVILFFHLFVQRQMQQDLGAISWR